MKKLMVAIAAAATALGLYAADDGFKSGNGFDSMTAGVKTLTELNTDDGNAWSSTDEGAAMEVKAYASGEALADEYRPAKYVGEGGITQANYLNVKTALDKTLTRSMEATSLTSADFYVDTLVKFTACDEDITTLGDDAAKIAVWVKEDETSGTTNLMITAGYIMAADGTVEQKNYDCGTFDGVDAWHRLTIKAIGDISKSGNYLVGFVVFIDGNVTGTALASDEAKGYDGYKAILNDVATLWDNNGQIFPSLKGTSAGAISALAVAGQGAIDDIAFTTTAPDFANKSAATITWPTDGKIASVVVDGEPVSPAVLAQGSLVIQAGVAVTVSATANDGYVITSDDYDDTPEANDVIEIKADVAGATFNGKGYQTVADAVKAANEITTAGNYTLKLLTGAEAISIGNTTEGVNLTLDLAGQTITQGEGDAAITVSAGVLTIADSVGGGIVAGNGTEASAAIAAWDVAAVLTAGQYDGPVAGSAITVCGETTKISVDGNEDVSGFTVLPEGKTLVKNEVQTYWIVGDAKKGWAIYLAAGDEANEFLISSEDDLFALATYMHTTDDFPTEGIKFTQTKDIDLNGIAWNGIGAANNKDNLGKDSYINGAFKGTYDGGNYTVSNITLSREDYNGFFGSLYGATIKDLKLSAAGTGFSNTGSLSADWSGGLVVGVSVKSTIENVETLEGAFTAEKASAGIVGYAAGGTVLKGCVNRLNVTSVKNEKVAGLVACAQNSGEYTPAEVVIDGCANYGNVECQTSGKTRAALLVSYSDTAVKFQSDITARGTVTQKDSTVNIQSIININSGTATVAEGAVITAPAGMKTTIHNNKAHAGLNYATVQDDVATLVADSAAKNGANLKVMTTGNTITLAAGESITLDETLASATVTTSATGYEVTKDGNTYKATPKSYGITYAWMGVDEADVEKIVNSNPTTYTFGTGVTSFADASCEGYTFKGWNPTSIATDATEAKTITGTFEKQSTWPAEWPEEADDDVKAKFAEWRKGAGAGADLSTDLAKQAFLLNVAPDAVQDLVIEEINVIEGEAAIVVTTAKGQGGFAIDLSEINGVLFIEAGDTLETMAPKAFESWTGDDGKKYGRIKANFVKAVIGFKAPADTIGK